MDQFDVDSWIRHKHNAAVDGNEHGSAFFDVDEHHGRVCGFIAFKPFSCLNGSPRFVVIVRIEGAVVEPLAFKIRVVLPAA